MLSGRRSIGPATSDSPHPLKVEGAISGGSSDDLLLRRS
jgi:hypothetical protein